MKVRGIEMLTLGDLLEEVRQGGRFVVFHWCVGLVIRTSLRPSVVRFVRPGESAGRGIWRSLASVVTGWWAIPFGPRTTLACVKENFAGGRDITASVLRTLVGVEQTRQRAQAAPLTSHAA